MHILSRHPELSNILHDCLEAALSDPDEIRGGLLVQASHMFVRWFHAILGEACGGRRRDRSPSGEGLGRHSVCGTQTQRRERRVDTRLTIDYDREGDILYISKLPPYPEQESEEIGDEVVARLNPSTGEVEALEILFFSTRLLRSNRLELPVTTEMRLAPLGMTGI